MPDSSDRATSGRARAANTRARNRRRALEAILSRSAREAGTVGVTPSLFVQAMLPHTEPRENGRPALVYTATNGDFTLAVRAGTDRLGQSLGVPYGGRARLLLAHLCTLAHRRYGRRAPRTRRAGSTGRSLDPEAVEHARTLDLGDSLAALMAELDITPTGGANGSVSRLSDQLIRLATCVVTNSWERAYDNGSRRRRDFGGEHVLLAQRFRFWWQAPHPAPSALRAPDAADAVLTDPAGRPLESSVSSPAALPLSGGRIVLSEVFARDVLTSAVPIDLRKLQFLRAHPLAMDLYVWCTYNAQRLAASGRAEKAVPFAALHRQLGGHYGDSPRGQKDFGYRARSALAAVQTVWPALNVETPRGRFVLRTDMPDVAL